MEGLVLNLKYEYHFLLKVNLFPTMCQCFAVSVVEFVIFFKKKKTFLIFLELDEQSIVLCTLAKVLY